MKKLLQTIVGCMGIFSAAAQTAFTPGNLVVLQTTGTVSKASSAITLKEFTPAGVTGLSVSLPVTGPTPIQSAGVFGGSEGFLTTSADGKYLVLAGYATTQSFTDITGTTAASVPRAVGLVYPSGFYLQYDTSTTFFSANDIRGAISDGTNFWAAGASNNSIDGIDYYGPGPRAAVATSSAPPKAYGMRIFNGQLYFSTQKTFTGVTLPGVFSVGTGLPTSGSPTITQVITIPATSTTPQDFSFNAASDVCYVAINLNSAIGGVQKWTRSGTTWTLAYTLGTGTANVGAYGLVVDYSGANPVIYATTTETSGNRVVKIVDNGTLASAVVTNVVAATAGTFYKGITFAPVASGTPLVNLSVNRDTASEAGATVITVTANASAPVVGNQTVTLNISGTGITTGDYALSNATISILNGATSGSVTFTVVDDILGEGTEKAVLTISSPSAGIALGMRTVQNVTIADNDGNNAPTIVMNTNTTDFIDGGVSVAPASPFKAGGVINDPTDPVRTSGINFTINDLETVATTLTVSVLSSNTTVVPTANVLVTGAGASKNVKITPAAVGYSNITIRVSDGIDVASYVINYAASAASATPANTIWHTGMSDGSDAIALDDNYYISADDEINVLNVYSRTSSGLPLVSYNYTSNLNLPDLVKPEADIEAAAKSPLNPNKAFWLGSMSNGKAPFDAKPNRDRIFATTYTGTGATTAFTFSGYTALKAGILAWGDAHGYNFTASAAVGVDSKAANGFAAEGMVFGPDNTTLYIGLRAPLVPTAARTKAVIVPVMNFEAWFNNGAPSGSATYGEPIELNLGGRGIRDITRLSNGSYVIVAGNSAGDPNTSAIYKWTGKAQDAPIAVPSPVDGILNLEGVMQVNTGGVLSVTSLQLISDMGDDVLYNDGTAAKDFNDLIYRKFRSDVVTSIDLTYPEINLQGNSVSIADGDITPATADNTDFGNVNFGATSTKTFVIQNTGTATLTVTAMNIAGTDAASFSFVGAPSFPLSIAPNGSQTITIQFSAGTLGVKNATLNISSNDADEALYDVALRATGVCAPIAAYTVNGSGAICAGGAGQPISLSSSDAGINYQLYNSINPVGAAVAGNGASIGFGAFTVSGTYTVLGTHVASGCTQTMSGLALVSVNPLPAIHNTTGGGEYCIGGTGVSIGLDNSATGTNYQLYRGLTAVGSALAGTGSAMNFGLQTATGAYTVKAINATTGCNTNMNGSAVVITNALPAAYLVTGGGAYCDGGAGVHAGLAGSATGVNYELYLAGAPSGTQASGTGGSLDFGAQTAGGIYTVRATDMVTGCNNTMTGSATVSVNPLPTAYMVTGSGSYCAGGAGHMIGLDLSETGISYQLYGGAVAAGSAVTGTGAAINFGLHTAGTYTISATNAVTGCSNAMMMSAVVTTNPLPLAFAISGGGTYCAGGTGLVVGLSNSETGVNYQLYNGSIAVGSAIAGTGAALDYGAQMDAGVYTIVATNSTTSCAKTMTGSAAIIVNPLVTPAVTIAATPGDTVCAGTAVTYAATPANGGLSPAYQWTVNGTNVGTGASYTFVPVNGNVVKVVLTSSELCAAPVTATRIVTMNVIANRVPTLTLGVSPGTSVCRGTAVNITAMGTYGGNSPVYRWYKNGINVSAAASYSYMPIDGDVIYCEMVSNYRCLATTVPAHSPNAELSVPDPLIPVVSIAPAGGWSAVPGHNDTLIATVTDGVAPTYQWYKGSTAIAGATSATLISNTLANNDSVSCKVTNTDACNLSAFNSVIIHKSAAGLSSVSDNMQVVVSPNPNNGTFNISGNTGNSSDAPTTLKVINMLGQVVYSNTVSTHNGFINEQVSLPGTAANGMYTLQVTSGSSSNVFHIIVTQ